MVVVALLGTGGLPFPAAGQTAGSLDLEPDEGEAGSAVVATVAGFDDCRPEDGGPVVDDVTPEVEDVAPEVEEGAPEVENGGTGVVAFTWTDGRSLGAVTLGDGGGGVSNVLIPQDAEAGAATMTASCASDEELSASASFTVVPPPDDGDEGEPPDERPPGDAVEPPEDEEGAPGPDDAGLDGEPGTDRADDPDDAAVAAEDVGAPAGPWLWILTVAIVLVIVVLLVRALRRAGDVRWARRHVRVVAGSSPHTSAHVDPDLHRAGTTLTLRLEPRADAGVSHLEEVP